MESPYKVLYIKRNEKQLEQQGRKADTEIYRTEYISKIKSSEYDTTANISHHAISYWIIKHFRDLTGF